jgi:hypothetical protein
MSNLRDIPLAEIEDLPKGVVDKLGQLWLTTAEQLVSTAATPGGLTSLAQHLEVSTEEAGRFIQIARSRLSPEVAARVESPVDTSEYGLGVIGPPKDDEQSHDDLAKERKVPQH